MKKHVKLLICTASLMIIFIIYTFLVKFVDVQSVGALNSKVGFATINKKIFDLIGTSNTWYEITEFLGYVIIALFGVGFAILAIYQLAKRKKLRLVDYRIYALIGFCVVVLLFYVLFEFVIVNYRPILMTKEVELEASYPSSHTMLCLCLSSSTMIALHKMFPNKKTIYIIDAVCIISIIIMIIGRILSGVHWITDIIGAIILSSSLIMLYQGIIELLELKFAKSNNLK